MKYNTLEELREAHRIKALAYYNKVKDDPEFKKKRKDIRRKSYLKKKNQI